MKVTLTQKFDPLGVFISILNTRLISETFIKQIPLCGIILKNTSVTTYHCRPLVKTAYQSFFILFLNQNICCGYSKESSQ